MPLNPLTANSLALSGGKVPLALGGTGSDLSGTGPGLLSQATSGANVTIAALGQIPGVATSSDAVAGNVGEIITSSVVSSAAVSLSSSVVSNVTSILLSPGDWDVSAMSYFTGGTGAAVSYLWGLFSTSSNTSSSPVDLLSQGIVFINAEPAFSHGPTSVTVPSGPSRVSISSSTRYYLNVVAAFSSNVNGYGMIRARRVR